MSSNKIKVKEELLCILDTRNCTSYYNDNMLSDVEWDLKDVIKKPKQGVQFSVSVITFSLPQSQYIVNSHNNILLKKRGALTEMTTLPSGNYNITELVAVINELISTDGYTLEYSATTNNLSMTHLTSSFYISKDSTCWELLGLSRTENTQSVNLFGQKTAYFPNCCNVSGLNNVNIELNNIATKNINSFDKSIGSVILAVPVDVNAGGILSYQRNFEYEIAVPIDCLEFINIVLKDDLGNFLELNGVHWNLTLKFSYFVEREFDQDNFEKITQNNKLMNIVKPRRFITEVPKIFETSN